MTAPDNTKSQNHSENLLLIGLPTAIIVGLALWFASGLVEPAPPKSIAIATGSKTGAYISFGKAYSTVLARSGIDLDVRTSRGTVDNLAKLSDPDSGIDVALVQGGVASAEQAKALVSIGRMFYEPLWVFYRGSETITTLVQLSSKRIAIGPQGSGTRRLALDLLKVNNVTKATANLRPISGRKAANALKAGTVDAIFVVAAPSSTLVRDLLGAPGLRLMNFDRARAYARRFPYLAVVELPRGVIDLVNNVPTRDIQLIAPVAALVARKNLHSALISLLAEAAVEVHTRDGLFQRTGEFPKSEDPVFDVSEDARRYYKSGKPFLRRYLPFWMVVLFERLLVFLLPILTILIPLFKIVPLIYRWRIRRRVLRWYVKLNELERDAEKRPQQDYAVARMQELERIDRTAKAITVPLQYTDELYALREHIEHVRRRLLAIETNGSSPIE